MSEHQEQQLWEAQAALERSACSLAHVQALLGKWTRQAKRSPVGNANSKHKCGVRVDHAGTRMSEQEQQLRFFATDLPSAADESVTLQHAAWGRPSRGGRACAATNLVCARVNSVEQGTDAVASSECRGERARSSPRLFQARAAL